MNSNGHSRQDGHPAWVPAPVDAPYDRRRREEHNDDQDDE